MFIREEAEAREELYLSKFASKSKETKGRVRSEVSCSIRTEYQRDRDRILHCKAFRRLKHKTQVFLAPEKDHYRTRLTHTLEVSQIARTIAKALRLNEDLTEAIALGHDLGHTPFGHAGEEVLNKLYKDGFKHNEQSVRVVEFLEKAGLGLNLTWEVRDGMKNHGTADKPSTLEGHVVRLADKIAYINHDIDDSIRAKIITEEQIPKEFTKVLGDSVRKRLDTLVTDVIMNSIEADKIIMSDTVLKAMMGLRKWMFDNVYRNEKAKSEEGKAKELVAELYHYYLQHIDKMPLEYQKHITEHKQSEDRVVCDYIAGMTDQYAIETFEEVFVPKAWRV